MDIQEGDYFTSSVIGKPSMYITSRYTSTCDGREFEFVKAVCLDKFDKISRHRQISLKGLKDELSAFNYEKTERDFGDRIISSYERKQLKEEMIEVLYDSLPSFSRRYDLDDREEGWYYGQIHGSHEYAPFWLKFRPFVEKITDGSYEKVWQVLVSEDRDAKYKDSDLATSFALDTTRKGMEILIKDLPNDLKWIPTSLGN